MILYFFFSLPFSTSQNSHSISLSPTNCLCPYGSERELLCQVKAPHTHQYSPQASLQGLHHLALGKLMFDLQMWCWCWIRCSPLLLDLSQEIFSLFLDNWFCVYRWLIWESLITLLLLLAVYSLNWGVNIEDDLWIDMLIWKWILGKIGRDWREKKWYLYR